MWVPKDLVVLLLRSYVDDVTKASLCYVSSRFYKQTTLKERLKWNLMRIYEDKLGAWTKLKEGVLTLASNSNYLHMFGDVEICSLCLCGDERIVHSCRGYSKCDCGKNVIVCPPAIKNLKCDWCNLHQAKMHLSCLNCGVYCEHCQPVHCVSCLKRIPLDVLSEHRCADPLREWKLFLSTRTAQPDVQKQFSNATQETSFKVWAQDEKHGEDPEHYISELWWFVKELSSANDIIRDVHKNVIKGAGRHDGIPLETPFLYVVDMNQTLDWTKTQYEQAAMIFTLKDVFDK